MKLTPEAEQNAMLERLATKHGLGYGIPGAGTFRIDPHVLPALRELLQAVQERERWISVEEKLPCPDSAVLIVLTATDKNKTFASQERVFWGYFEGRKDQPTWQHDDKNAESEFWKVTHWRPLPKPPGEAQTYADLFQESTEAE